MTVWCKGRFHKSNQAWADKTVRKDLRVKAIWGVTIGLMKDNHDSNFVTVKLVLGGPLPIWEHILELGVWIGGDYEEIFNSL